MHCTLYGVCTKVEVFFSIVMKTNNIQLCSFNPIELIAKYYPTSSAAFNLLVSHSTDVAELALAIARRKSDLNIDQGFLYEAAMLHDIGIFLTNSPYIYCYGREPYIKHGLIGARILRQHHLPRHALVAERHTSSGLSIHEIIQEKLPFPLDRSYMPESLEEKLVCYADCFYSKVYLGQRNSEEEITKKMARTWRKFGFEGEPQNVKRFEELHALFAIGINMFL